MKNKLIIVMLFFAINGIANAQEKRSSKMERKENIEALKVGWLTKKLNLTSDEAKVFWPVYNQYDEDVQKLRKSRRFEKEDTKNNFDSMSEKDLEKFIDDEIAFRQNELDILKKYHSKFKQVLPIKKVALLYRAEQDFKRELLKKMKKG